MMNIKDAASMPTGAFYPGLVTERFFETWDFYTEMFGFYTLDENDDHVLLVHPSGARLEILRHETNGRHPELVCATTGQGLWFTLEVGDVDSEYLRLRDAGVTLLHPPENRSRGSRSFTVRDPNGVLICLMSRQETLAYEWAGADGRLK